MNIETDKIARFQKYLSVFRRLAGLSADDLADELEITRQTICNLEKGQSVKMTKIQYIAIRSVFDYIIQNASDDNRDNADKLQDAIYFLVDKDAYTEDEKKRLKLLMDKIDEANHDAETKKKKAVELTKNIMTAALSVAFVSSKIIISNYSWMSEIMNTAKYNKNRR